jgi:hypothetical protein
VALFPTPVYYPGVAVMLLGNLGLLYELLHACLEEAEYARGRFDLVRYMLMAQLMWLWMSRSTYIAVFELVTGKRAWHKTPHGHAEAEEAAFRRRDVPRQSAPVGWQAAPFGGHSLEGRHWAESESA